MSRDCSGLPDADGTGPPATGHEEFLQLISQLRGAIAKQIGLTDDDLKATLPSGSLLFANRLHWTITYLHQADLVRRPRRAVVQITRRGRDVLAAHPVLCRCRRPAPVRGVHRVPEPDPRRRHLG